MNVYFSVDTETSIGGALRHPERRPLKADVRVFCRIAGEDHGIGLLTKMLNSYGFSATHFVETLAGTVAGYDDLRSVFDYLLQNGQDVQLHAHPVFYFYGEWLRAREAGQPYTLPPIPDRICEFSENSQYELLDRAVDLFRRCAGMKPVAFRAASFAASRQTLRCIHKLGMRLDSSFNPCFAGQSFAGEEHPPNQLSKIEGIWELPVTVARTPLPEGFYGLRHADPSVLSFSELRFLLETSAAQGQSDFVILFHSFAMVKSKDETYRFMRPDGVVIRRVRRLLEYIAKRPNLYRVQTFSAAATQIPSRQPCAPVVPTLRPLDVLIRKSVQAANRWYWL